MAKVYLIGAGPGDVELITLKALRIIKRADAIVYDRLVNTDLLSYAPKSCETIFVGKSAGAHSKTQDEINALLVSLAKKHKTVVRLKGGDPVVFGRGGEEALYLKKHGIDFTFIPGVSSAIAVAENALIPLTHRNYASSLKIVTGHQSVEGKYRFDPETLRTEGTLVILMGLHNLKTIIQELLKQGKDPSTPVAVISQGTTPNETILTATLETVMGASEEIDPPAVVIVGEVVTLRDKLLS